MPNGNNPQIFTSFNAAFLDRLNQGVVVIDHEIGVLQTEQDQLERNASEINHAIKNLNEHIRILQGNLKNQSITINHLRNQLREMDHDLHHHTHCRDESVNLNVQIATYAQVMQQAETQYTEHLLELTNKESALRQQKESYIRLGNMKNELIRKASSREVERAKILEWISECQTHLQQLNVNPGELYQKMVEYLRISLAEFSYQNPQFIASVEEAILIEMKDKLNFFDNLPAENNEQVRQKLAGLIGLSWDCLNRAKTHYCRDDFIHIFETVTCMSHIACDNDLPDHMALGKSVKQCYLDYQYANPEMLSDLDYDAVEAHRVKRFDAAALALQQKLNSYPDRPEYQSLIESATNVLNSVTAMSKDVGFDRRLYANILESTRDVVNNPGNPNVQTRYLEVCELHYAGRQSKKGLIIGAALITLAVAVIVVGAVFTCGAFGLLAGAIFSTCILAKISNIAAIGLGAYCLYQGAKGVHDSRRKGLHVHVHNTIKASNKIPPNIRMNLFSPPNRDEEKKDKVVHSTPGLKPSMVVDV